VTTSGNKQTRKEEGIKIAFNSIETNANYLIHMPREVTPDLEDDVLRRGHHTISNPLGIPPVFITR
jgi:hypothetical protein